MDALQISVNGNNVNITPFCEGVMIKKGILTVLIRVAGCLLGITDSKLHVIYGTSGKTAH